MAFRTLTGSPGGMGQPTRTSVRAVTVPEKSVAVIPAWARLMRSDARELSQAAGMLCIVAMSLTIVSRQLDLATLEAFVRGLRTVHGNTALCFLLTGASLYLQARAGPRHLSRTGILLGGFILVIAGVTAVERLLGAGLGVDDWIFSGDSVFHAASPDRMSLAEASAFVMGGAGLMVSALPIHTPLRALVRAGFGTVVLVIGLLSVIGVAADMASGNHLLQRFGVPAYKASLFLVIGVGLLTHAKTESGGFAWALGPRVTAALLGAVLLVLLTFGFTHALVGEFSQTLEVSDSDLEQMENVDTMNLVAAQVDADMGRFGLTGDQGHWENVRNGLQNLEQGLRQLEALSDDPVQMARTMILGDSLLSYRTGATILAEKYVAAGYGDLARVRGSEFEHLTAQMLTIERLLFELRTEWRHQVQERRARVVSDSGLLAQVVIVGTLTSLLILAAVFLALNREVSERRRAEERQKRYSADLARSNADLEQFAYVASHDLQEPLRAVAGSVDLLQFHLQDRMDDRSTQFIRHAIEGVERMQTLINDLLRFSRVGTRGDPLVAAESAVLLDRALANMAVTLREKHVIVERGHLPPVIADGTQLAQVFQNLIANGIKFCRDRRPKIRVGAVREGAEWIFSVQDNGIGIEPKYFERIFVIFQRLHTRTEFTGTGIGLALCKKIIERHGGRIWVESSPGEGSTFHFSLPVGAVKHEHG